MDSFLVLVQLKSKLKVATVNLKFEPNFICCAFCFSHVFNKVIRKLQTLKRSFCMENGDSSLEFIKAKIWFFFT